MNKNKILIILISINFFFLLSISPILSLKTMSTQNIGYIDNSIKIANSDRMAFTRAVISGPTVLDPVDSWEQAANEVIRQVAETLWFYNWNDPSLPRINMLAESEQWLNTTALRVTLQQGIQFHDATPFNADAVKWNIDRLQYLCNHTGQLTAEERTPTPASLYEDPLGNAIIEGFEVTGTYTGIIHLTQPFSSIMDLMCYAASSIISPTAHAGDEHTFIDLATGDLVGTGPYKYDEYIAEQEVRFSRWDGYWGGPMPINTSGGIAFFEEMVYKVIDDPSMRNYAMLAHDVDYLTGIISDLVDTFKNDPSITFHESSIPGFGVSYLAFNNKQINITWRKAMCYAFDYDYMVKDYWQDRVFQSYGWVSPGYGEWYTDEQETRGPYFNVTIARMILRGDDPTEYPVDGIPEAAGRSLDDVDWIGKNLITFNYSYNTDNAWRADLFILLDVYFADISINVLDGGTDWAYFLYRVNGYVPGGYDELQIFWVGWGPDYLDPINMIQPLLSNVSFYNRAKVNDPWIENAFIEYFAEGDHATRVEMIHDISVYCITQLFSHMFGFHALTQTCHLADLYNVPYYMNRYTFYAYPIKSSTYPQITSSGDIEFLEGETGNTITWNLSAENLNNPIYYTYRDNGLLSSDTWESGDSINVNVDSLFAGEYVFKIVVQNGERSNENYVNVRVLSSLSITHPYNINYLEGSTGNNIAWYVLNGSTQNAMYDIYNESGLVRSDTWQIGVPIVLNVDGLSEGVYSYSIEVHNALEFIEDTVEVNVFTIPEPPTEEPPQIIINSPTESEIFGSSAPEYNISIINSYNTIWYTIDDGITNITSSELIGTINQTEWNKKEDGILTITFYAENSEGLIGSAEIMVVKHITGGGTDGIPSYNLIALVGIAIMTTLIITKKKFKK